MTREQIHIGDMSHETAIGILKLMLEAMETYDGISPTTERINAMKMAIKALEQEPTTKNELSLIHTEGLDEEIRCTMCTNYMKSDRGCDGNCVVNKDMYKAVMDAIEKRIKHH